MKLSSRVGYAIAARDGALWEYNRSEGGTAQSDALARADDALAALLATCDELLEALKGVAFALECDDDDDWNARVRACHAAIAKAEGR